MKSIKKQTEIHIGSSINVIDELVASVREVFCLVEPIVVILSIYDAEEVQGYDEFVVSLSYLSSYSKNLLKFDIDLKN